MGMSYCSDMLNPAAIEAARQLHASGMSAQHAAENVQARFDLSQNECDRVAAAVEWLSVQIKDTRIGGIKLAPCSEPVPVATKDFRGCCAL